MPGALGAAVRGKHSWAHNSDNERNERTSMKTIITLLRILFGILVGFVGCIALLNAPYQLLNANFSFANGGPFILISLIVGGLLLWGAWRLIRGHRVDSPASRG